MEESWLLQPYLSPLLSLKNKHRIWISLNSHFSLFILDSVVFALYLIALVFHLQVDIAQFIFSLSITESLLCAHHCILVQRYREVSQLHMCCVRYTYTHEG